jgi:hypothetical protein
VSGFFDPLAPFNTGNYDCDPYLEPDCSPPLYGPPLTVNQPIIVIVNDYPAALGSVQTAVNNLTGVTASIISLLGGLFNLLLSLLALLKQLWTKVLKPLADNVKGIIDDLKKKLDKILKPILDALKAQRKALLDFYNKFIRPLIAFIESIRRFIHILQIFHIHLLDGLDAQLAKLEAKIMGPFLAALGRINTLGNWISFILNTRLLIFRGLFLGSMNAYRGGSFTMLAGTPGYGIPLLPDAGASQSGQPITSDTHQTAIAAVKAAAPAIAARYAGTPVQEFVLCMTAPIGNVEVAGALDEMFACVLTSSLNALKKLNG